MSVDTGICQPGLPRALDSRPVVDPGGNSATRVLVVDDEPSIRLLCRVSLERDGHVVVEADSLAGAKATLAAEDVHVLVLDVHLHGELGEALASECHARRPPIAVVDLREIADDRELE